jgi:pSer/pThr/pTyr-binding forkhead associated (FHA) protein
MNGLDFFENRIKALIEKSASFFPWVDQSAELMANLSEAIRDTLFLDNMQVQNPPNRFIVKMNPQDMAVWKAMDNWKANLSNAYLSILNEYGLRLDLQPDFDLVSDYTIDKGQFRFEAITEEKSMGTVNIIHATQVTVEQKPSSPLKPPVLIFDNQREIALTLPVTNIGRRSTCDIVIDDIRISRTHAQIRRTQKGYVLFDTGSAGGTFVNHERIFQRTLNSGDVISLSGFQFVYSDEHNLMDAEHGQTDQVTKGGE